ncbi:Peptidoglycan/LPS O-acetylase OafA/YrhL, contains acyltransferase and SGNH-hydrolase domains [Pseudobutyrivibrio sp. ACV-2]|uniref:acyltransferase family protein n=1 Tax=Pseudobutyrivibrio sp. ACV-2 TaxID=1520801 RepID=UPI0008992A93|nr:acyltransferase [Pseudobutyrivibrio sp. ACV-2]SEA75834.1 Peptidoglycan/LPS O-acetylase OafA/YrhL, contains acyltransferase and SGNH-hydrolase domains [Pseudobutyrivibrio sp. ACV-2]
MKKRIFGLDILRVIGVLFIFAYHYTISYLLTAGGQEKIMADMNYFFNIMARPASISLFLISGYALMHNHEENIPLKDYFIRRFKGIYIPFYVAYFMMFFLYFFVNNKTPGYYSRTYTFIDTILGIDGVMNQLHSNFYMIGEWFMSCIVICYLLFPLLSRLLHRFDKITLAALVIWSAFVLYVRNPFPLEVFKNPLFVVVYFYLGMFLYKYFGDKTFSPPARTISLIIFIAALVYFMIAGYMPQMMPVDFSLEIKEIFYAAMAITLFVLLRDVDVSPEKTFYKVIAYISKISWYVILTHHAIMILFFYYRDVTDYGNKDFVVLFMLFVILSTLAAEIVMRTSNWIKKNAFNK